MCGQREEHRFPLTVWTEGGTQVPIDFVDGGTQVPIDYVDGGTQVPVD